MDYPLLSLEELRESLGYNPFHFWGMKNETVPSTSSTNNVMKQHPYKKAGVLCREDLKAATLDAENRLKNYLGYSIAPHYITETLQFPTYPDVRFDRVGYGDSGGRWISIQLKEGFIENLGVMARTLIIIKALDFTTEYLDSDGDTLKDYVKFTVATTVTNPDEIALYYSAGDRIMSLPLSEEHRIKPISVSISGGVATIQVRAWQMVKPIKHEGFDTEDLDPAVAGNFLSTVDVYRVYTNTAGTTVNDCQVKLIWETRPYPSYAQPAQNAEDPSATASAMARGTLRNGKLGIIGIGEAVYDSGSGEWIKTSIPDLVYPPDRLEVRYKAGYPLENGRVASLFKTVDFRMAIAELSRPAAAARDQNSEIATWQFDMARTGGANSEAYGAISMEDLANPFGTRRGHVYAWKEVKALRLMRGVRV